TQPAAAINLQNFTIQNGRGLGNTLPAADLPTRTTGLGGGIYINLAGQNAGGITNRAQQTFTNVTLHNNAAPPPNPTAAQYPNPSAGGAGAGGGLEAQYAPSILLTNVTFSGNQAVGGAGDVRGGGGLGGGLHLYQSSAVGNNVTFTNNAALAGAGRG